jgi:hypothetical protein
MAAGPTRNRPPLLDEALAHGGPIVVFDRVSLAFDEKVILTTSSFTLKTGDTRRSSWARAARGSPRSCG